MMRFISLMVILLSASVCFGQMAVLEGYVFESNNRGYLNQVKIEITDKEGSFKTKTISNREGFFTCEIPTGKDFTLVALKDIFEYTEIDITSKNAGPKVYAKVEMEREPGFLFEVTMAEKWIEGKEEVNAISDALIEIYNNTADTSVLVLSKHPTHTFSHTFEQGNHYTVMIRKEGYFTKRLEAFVNVDGCIMCFEGIDEVQPGQPGIADNLTAGHVMGTLVANVELEEIRVGEAIKIENIYYDLGKADIRDDATKPLDNLIHVLKNNPSLMVELGSHTDSQGNDESNFSLSSSRAQAAVDYIVGNSSIRKARIQARGYGETQLTNGCKNGVKCSDRKHQQNRRTELKIVGIADYDPFADKTLEAIIRGEKFEETLAEIQNQDVVQFESGEVPDEILAQAGKLDKPSIPKTPTSRPAVKQPKPKVSTSAPAANEVVASSSTDLVGENEQEIDLGLDTKIPTSSAGTSVSMGEYEIKMDDDYAQPLAINKDYTGFVVEFFRSTNQLPASHLIFQKHGNIITDVLGDGSVSYMLGDFKTKSDAEKFLKHIVSKEYQNSKVIVYRKGSRS